MLSRLIDLPDFSLLPLADVSLASSRLRYAEFAARLAMPAMLRFSCFAIFADAAVCYYA